MIWAFALALFLTSISHAGHDRPLYASYCSALLENQRASDTFEREVISATLNQFAAKTAERLRLNESFAKRVESFEPEGRYVYVWLEGDETHQALVHRSLAFLRRVPQRVMDLQTDIYSIQDGVVAGAMEIRGQVEILDYLQQLKSSVSRNEAELRPAYLESHPYVTKKRLAANTSLIAIPTAAAGAVAWWTVPSLLNLDVSLPQALTLSMVPPLGWISQFMYWPAGTYFRGLFSEKYREMYEDLFGINSGLDRYYRFTNLEKIVRNASAKPDALIHVIDERIFSEAEMRELKAAAEAKRATSLDFAETHELAAAWIAVKNLDLPISYTMTVDLIYFFDEKVGEPVLVIIDRFSRQLPTPTKRKRKLKDAAANWGFGGLRPAGL